MSKLHTLWAIPLVLAAAVTTAGCQAPDPTVECARLATELQGLIDRSQKPPLGLDVIAEHYWYRQQPGILLNLQILSEPYGKQLKTPDPISFCQKLTGESVLPSGVPNPYRK